MGLYVQEMDCVIHLVKRVERTVLSAGEGRYYVLPDIVFNVGTIVTVSEEVSALMVYVMIPVMFHRHLVRMVNLVLETFAVRVLSPNRRVALQLFVLLENFV